MPQWTKTGIGKMCNQVLEDVEVRDVFTNRTNSFGRARISSGTWWEKPRDEEPSLSLFSSLVNHLGLTMHEIVKTSEHGTSLGVRYDGELGIVAPHSFRKGIHFSTNLFSSQEMACAGVVGHVTVRCILRRLLLSVSHHHAYKFISTMGLGRAISGPFA